MNITFQVITLFLVASVGILCRRLRYFTDETVHGVTQLVVNITLPCLTYYNMERPFSTEVLRNFLLILFLTLILLLLCLGGTWMLFSRRPTARRAVIANLCTFSNCGFMGYPIIMAINPDLMIYAVAYNISFSLVSWTLGVRLFSSESGSNLQRILRNPTLIACVLGFIAFCTGFVLPEVLDNVVSIVGGLTTPLSMLLIGAHIYGVRPSELKDPDYHLVALLRLIVYPLLLLLLRFTPVPASLVTTLFILTAMPCGTMVSMQAELYHGDVSFASKAVAWSTLLAIATVPILCTLL